ncbi:MAG: hypothetical protein A2079_02490 [Geobacteraceae bacterium GWC2_48_7]|nr:MAG: hypothetical protein A2079_02490 [Geobacteraceae bacterium GWC2_48_7]
MSALKNNNAFTLIEFVVSVLILTVGLLGLLQTINTAISNNMGNTLRNEATVVADEQLSSRIAQLSTSNSTGFTSANTSLKVSRKIHNGFKNYSVVRTEVSTGSGSLEVNVLISWKHKNNRYTHNAASVVSKR